MKCSSAFQRLPRCVHAYRAGGGGGWTISLQRSPTPNRVPHRVPNPTTRMFCHVSRFGSPLHGVPSPTIWSFRVVPRFGSPLHGVPSPTIWSFRMVSRFGAPLHGVPNAQSHDAVVSSRFVFHRVPNPGTSVVPTTSTLYVTLWLCVIERLATMRGTA